MRATVVFDSEDSAQALVGRLSGAPTETVTVDRVEGGAAMAHGR